MKYIYNAERDRIACRVWKPHFAIVTFEEPQTKEQRTVMLYSCTNLERHLNTIAEKYAEDGERLKEIKEVSREVYEKWLCGDADSIDIETQKIPVRYITDFLIAQDSPEPGKSVDSRYGSLARKKALLLDRDANLLQEILESWEKSQPEKDIVREVPDPKFEPVLTDLE